RTLGVQASHLMSEVSMIQTVCPNCSQLVSFRDYLAGFQVKCPECGSPVDVPAGPPASEPGPAEAVMATPARETPAERLPADEPFRADLPSEFNVPKVTSPWSRRLKWVGIGLAIPAVAGLLAYLLRGGSAWEILSIILAVLLGFLSLALLK